MVYGKSSDIYSSSSGDFRWKEINKYLPSLNFDSESKGYLPGSIPLPRENETLDILQADMLSLTHIGLKNYRSRMIMASEPFRSSIRKFYLALDGYLESSNPVMTGPEIISKVCFDLNAADYFKKLKIKSFIKTQDLDLLEIPDWYDSHPFHQISDIGDVFNYSYVPHITEEIDDYIYSRLPLDINQECLKTYSEMIDYLLPDEGSFPIIDPREVLLRTTSSSQFIPASGVKGLTIENWKIKSQFMNFSSKPLRGKRAVIQVGPEGARDTVILPPDQVNTITLIERQVHAIIQQIDGNGMIDNSSEFMDEVHKLRKNYEFFLCRDFTKEGLTKPRILIEIILEKIGKKYPKLASFCELKNIYSNYSVLIDGEFESFPRGHGLGMANSLTTFMQIVIFFCVLKNLSVEDMNISSKCDMLSYNDDFVAGFDSEFFLESYWDHEGDFLEGLGVLRKPSKSFKGNDFVFCEVYGKSLNRKESFLRREILCSMACTNIVQAKELISSLGCSINREILDEYMEEIIAYWGYEFHPLEVNFPSRFGGWRNTLYKGIDFCMTDMEVDFNLRALYEASKIVRNRAPIRGSSKDKYINPYEYLFSITEDDIPTEYRCRLNFGTEREVSKNFNRMSINPGHLAYLYRQCQKDRVEKYSQWLNKPQTGFSDLKDIVAQENPLVTFVDLYSRNRVTCFQTDRERFKERMWNVDNPQLSFLKYLLPEKVPQDNIVKNPIPFLLGKGPGYHRIFQTQTDIVRVEYDYASLRVKEDPKPYEIEKFEFEFGRNLYSKYIDPQVAGELSALFGFYYVPIPWRNSPSPEIFKIRDGVYKLNPTQESQININFDDETFVYLMSLDPIEFSMMIPKVNSIWHEVMYLQPEEEKPPPAPDIPQEEKTVNFDSISDHYWAWVSDPKKYKPYPFFEEIKGILDLIVSIKASVAGATIERILEMNKVEPRWFNLHVIMLGFTLVPLGPYRIPSYLVEANHDGFESDESFGGGLFDE